MNVLRAERHASSEAAGVSVSPRRFSPLLQPIDVHAILVEPARWEPEPEPEPGRQGSLNKLDAWLLGLQGMFSRKSGSCASDDLAAFLLQETWGKVSNHSRPWRLKQAIVGSVLGPLTDGYSEGAGAARQVEAELSESQSSRRPRRRFQLPCHLCKGQLDAPSTEWP